MTRRRTIAPETVKLNIADVRDSVTRAKQKQAALVVLQGSESDIGTHVLLKRTVTMGRDPSNELPLQDRGISRKHCRVSIIDGAYMVEDLRSTNGTLVNGARIEGRHRLRPGDRIFLGGCVIKFTHSDQLEVGYHAHMDNLVGTDDLTGLVAKRRFDAAFGRAVDAAREIKVPLSVMMLDLDNLKQINDAHGHPLGAHTIAEAGKIIGSVVTPHGAACRFGGDEFAVFLPNIGSRVAKQIAESIRTWVSQHRFTKDGVTVKTSISIGIASFPDDGDSADALLQKADEALYRAKRAGRDKVSR